MRRMRSRFSGGLLLLLLGFSWPAFSEQRTAATVLPPYLSLNQRYEAQIEELKAQIESKNKLLEEWLIWKEKETTLRQEQERAFEDQIATRNDAISARDLMIKGLKLELRVAQESNLLDLIAVGSSALAVGALAGAIVMMMAIY